MAVLNHPVGGAARAVLTPCLPVWTASTMTVVRMKDQRYQVKVSMNTEAGDAIPPGTDTEGMTIMDVKRISTNNEHDTNGHEDGRIVRRKPSQPYHYHIT